MSYARPCGDYKTGGYGRPKGDWGDIWAGVKQVGGQLLTGAIGGWLGQAGMQEAAPPIRRPTPMQVPPTYGYEGGPVSFPGGGFVGPGTITPGQGRLPPFTAVGPGVLPGGGRGGACAPSGYHFAKDGSGRLVRNRRMNIANPRALRRAMRRVQGFEKLARRTITFTRRVKMKSRKSSS